MKKSRLHKVGMLAGTLFVGPVIKLKARHAAMSLIAAAMLPSTMQASVLYSYDFTGSGEMNGQSLNGRTWWGGQLGGVPAQINANGNFSGDGNGQAWMQTGWQLTPGLIYDYKVTINLTGVSQYVGLGISANYGLWNIVDSATAASYVATGETFGVYYSGGLASGSGTYRIRVDATGADWTAAFFKNDIQQGATRIWTGQAPFGPAYGDGYAELGLLVFGQSGNAVSGTFSNLEFSATPVPEPSVAALAALGMAALAIRRRSK